MSRAKASWLLKNVRMSRVGTHLGRSGGHKGHKDDNEPQEPNIREIRRIVGLAPRIIRILGMFMTRVGHMRQEPRIHDHTCFTCVCGLRIRITLNFNEKSQFYASQRTIFFENGGFMLARAPFFGAEGGEVPRRGKGLVRVGFFTFSRKGVPALRRERIFRKSAERPRGKLKSSQVRL